VPDLYSACVNALFSLCAALLISWTFCACGSAAAPTVPAAPSTVSSLNLSGTWSGAGSDVKGPEVVTWGLMQSGATLSGTAELRALDPTDGSCGSCHKNKRGTFAGTLSGTTLTLTMTFPAGGADDTPLCSITLNGTASASDREIAATYAGADTCEGLLADGTLAMTRQR
jgi:hypothetical protein